MRVGNLTRVQCLVATFIAVVVLATVIHKVVEASSTGSGREGFFPSNWDKCAGNPCEARITGCIKTDSTKITLCCLDSDGDKVHHCITCTRDVYVVGPGIAVLGPPRNCRNPKEKCSP